MADPFDDDPWIGGASPTRPAPIAPRRRRSPLLAWAATAAATAAAVMSVITDVNIVAYAAALAFYALVLASAWHRSRARSDSAAQRELPSLYRWVLRPVSFVAVVVAAWGAAEALAL